MEAKIKERIARCFNGCIPDHTMPAPSERVEIPAFDLSAHDMFELKLVLSGHCSCPTLAHHDSFSVDKLSLTRHVRAGNFMVHGPSGTGFPLPLFATFRPFKRLFATNLSPQSTQPGESSSSDDDDDDGEGKPRSACYSLPICTPHSSPAHTR